ncbi:glutathione S-transferase family protein [Halomonas sp. GXIMD04776]|uniref:glutathione S-transferase family protein n=1 Tax=Halomonas sp. GXIMD04776 TaxID=3415605 RepID=UPI003CA25E9A
MIELHQFRPFWGLPNASPFCMKAETYLRYRKIPFRSVPSGPRRSPSGQIPFVVDGAQTVTDSQAIIEHFEARQPTHLDADLDEAQRAMAFFVRELVEERLYWQITYMRWGDPAGWRVFKPDLTPYLPRALRGPGLFAIRRTLLRRMRRRGLSPNDPATAYAQGTPVLDALSSLLGDKPFFLGETLHSLDMSLHAFLANILDQPHENPLQTHGRRLSNLVDYTQRMKALCYGE